MKSVKSEGLAKSSVIHQHKAAAPAICIIFLSFPTEDLVESCSVIAHIGGIFINKCDVQSGTKNWVYFAICTVWDK
jgi:hypothetical protein